MKTVRLSVVVSAYNEEKNIEECLTSVTWADEVIVIDNSSLDTTAKIAKKCGAKIFNKPNNQMLNINKNYGFSKATGDWILNLDADERISTELKEEIENWKRERGNSEIVGYWIPRKNIIFGKWIQHAGWYPDYQLRLFKRGHGKFPEKHVHEMISIEGKTEYLKNPLIHQNYSSIDQFLHKLSTIYTTNEAEQLEKKGYRFNYLDAIRFPFNEFLSRFFAREGYKDGLHGLILSLLMAFYHFIVFAKLWERQGFIQVQDTTFISIIEKESNKAGKEITYWFQNEKLKEIKNPLQLFVLKLKRKLF